MDGRYWLLGSALVGAALLCAIIYVVWLRRRRAARSRAPKPRRPLRHPVVLAHGVLGFDKVQLGGARAEYFRGVAERLRELGAEVYPVKVSPSAGIAVRAEQLAAAVRSIDAKKVNIIAHSMGGLDARYAISRLGLAAKVASLTTLGTPHRGTPIADLGTKLSDRIGLGRMVGALGIPVEAFYDLTTLRMEAFNREVPDHPKVVYGSFVAAVKNRLPGCNPLLLPGPPLPLRARRAERWARPAELAALGRDLGRGRGRPLGADRLVAPLRRAGDLRADRGAARAAAALSGLDPGGRMKVRPAPGLACSIA